MDKLKIKISLIIFIYIIISVTTIIYATTGKITENESRVRKEASTDSEIVTYLYNGNEVEVIEKSGDWYKIKYNEYEGYVYSSLIEVKEEVSEQTPIAETTKPEETPEAQELTITEGMNEEQAPVVEYPKSITAITDTKIYILPLITSTVISNAPIGQEIIINKVVNDWSYVSSNGIKGWARNYSLNNVQTTPPEQQTPVENQTTNSYTAKTAYINVSDANVRADASISASVVTTLTLNTEITIVNEKDDWYQIEYGEYKGFIAKRLVSDTKTEVTSRSQTEQRQETPVTQPVEKRTGYINVDVANIRTQADTNSAKLTTLKLNSDVTIIGETGDFYKISINGNEAYVAKRLISDEKTVIQSVVNNQTVSVPVTSNGTSSGNGVVEYAKQYLGYSYVWGGTTPQQGFDCTGFTYYIYNACGYSLSRSCSVQANSGTYVDKANLQPGDLLLFDNTSDGSIGHVGIYIGNGNFIHAANPRRGVVTDTINSGYYYTYYYSARRICN